MNAFDRAVDFVLEYEGGLVDDPADAGGVTKFGISQRAYPDLNIRELTTPAARQIYYEDYWLKCKCPELPYPLAMLVFDSAVNQGPSAAIKMLQQALGTEPDGVVGPITIAAGHRAELRKVTVDLAARRALRYALHPQVQQFGLGWYRRLMACLELTQEPLG